MCRHIQIWLVPAHSGVPAHRARSAETRLCKFGAIKRIVTSAQGPGFSSIGSRISSSLPIPFRGALGWSVAAAAAAAAAAVAVVVVAAVVVVRGRQIDLPTPMSLRNNHNAVALDYLIYVG